MADASIDRLKNILSQITESYDKIRTFESEGATKDQLKKELINIRDASDEMSPLIGLMIKENHSLGLDTVGSISEYIGTPYLQTIVMQIMLLTQPNAPNDSESMKVQANMAVSTLNGSGSINKFKFLLSIIR